MIAMISAIISCVVMSAVVILFIFHVGFDFWKDLVKEHFPGTIGLMGATILSFARLSYSFGKRKVVGTDDGVSAAVLPAAPRCDRCSDETKANR